MSDVTTKVKAIIVDKLGVDESEVTNEASFTNDLGADSLDTVELIMELENFLELQSVLEKSKVDFIVLAGFLLKIPEKMVEIYPDKIVNIHPALLPKYGGKGMYGSRVHKAVLENKESESGITIHFVNTKYDEGKIIFQRKCAVEKEDIPKSLANKIHKLEYEYFPKILASIIQKK